MAEKRTEVQNPDGTVTVYVKPDIIGIVGELVGCAGGLLAAGYVGTTMARTIPAATTTLEKVGRTMLIGSVSCATEYYVSEGVSKTFEQVSEISDWGAEKIKARSMAILNEAAGQQVTTTEAKKK